MKIYITKVFPILRKNVKPNFQEKNHLNCVNCFQHCHLKLNVSIL